MTVVSTYTVSVLNTEKRGLSLNVCVLLVVYTIRTSMKLSVNVHTVTFECLCTGLDTGR